MKKPKRLSISDLPDWRFGFFLFLAACARLAFARDALQYSPSERFTEFQVARNLVLNGFFGVGEQADAFLSPVYPTLLALTYKVVELEWRPYFLINAVSDIVALGFLLATARRSVGTLAGFGLLFVALCPLWTTFVLFPNSMNLSLALFSGFLYFWTKPKRGVLDEAFGGIFLGLLSLTRGVFFFFPLVVLALHFFTVPKTPKKKQRLLLHFIFPAMLLPLPWIVRNFLLIKMPVIATDTFAFAPSIPRAARSWFFDWQNPYATFWLPPEVAPLILWIFLPFISLLGIAGLIFRGLDGKTDPLAQVFLALTGYLMLASVLFPIDFRITWVSYAILSIWAGFGLMRLCGVRVKS